MPVRHESVPLERHEMQFDESCNREKLRLPEIEAHHADITRAHIDRDVRPRMRVRITNRDEMEVARSIAVLTGAIAAICHPIRFDAERTHDGNDRRSRRARGRFRHCLQWRWGANRRPVKAIA